MTAIYNIYDIGQAIERSVRTSGLQPIIIKCPTKLIFVPIIRKMCFQDFPLCLQTFLCTRGRRYRLGRFTFMVSCHSNRMLCRLTCCGWVSARPITSFSATGLAGLIGFGTDYARDMSCWSAVAQLCQQLSNSFGNFYLYHRIDISCFCLCFA